MRARARATRCEDRFELALAWFQQRHERSVGRGLRERDSARQLTPYSSSRVDRRSEAVEARLDAGGPASSRGSPGSRRAAPSRSVIAAPRGCARPPTRRRTRAPRSVVLGRIGLQRRARSARRCSYGGRGSGSSSKKASRLRILRASRGTLRERLERLELVREHRHDRELVIVEPVDSRPASDRTAATPRVGRCRRRRQSSPVAPSTRRRRGGRTTPRAPARMTPR